MPPKEGATVWEIPYSVALYSPSLQPLSQYISQKSPQKHTPLHYATEYDILFTVARESATRSLKTD